MAESVLMPKVGISVESCVIGSWKKRAGDRVDKGEVLFDYETDKASLECESTADGTILEIFFGDGAEVPVLTPVCAVGSPGEDISPLRPGSAEERGSPPVFQKTLAIDEGAASQRMKISPRARNLAERLGVDARGAEPTGPSGRIIARDIQAIVGGHSEYAKTETGFTEERIPMIRRAIADAMTASLRDLAQLTNHHSFDASWILRLREHFKEDGKDLGLDGVSIGDMVLFAAVRTLLEHPYMNAHMVGDAIRRFSAVNLGVAVDTQRGLMVPTVFGADKMSLIQLSRKVRELAESARSGNISPDLLQGATFTVSNLGAVGVEMFTPIINPPQVGILGVCGVTDRVRMGRGGLETYPAIGLSVTYDHRAVDGAPASRFAQALCRKLERFHLLLAI
jgi:pyruvate dehydrogenase E2 component (dihydrolipoamide acetyltransferase)